MVARRVFLSFGTFLIVPTTKQKLPRKELKCTTLIDGRGIGDNLVVFLIRRLILRIGCIFRPALCSLVAVWGTITLNRGCIYSAAGAGVLGRQYRSFFLFGRPSVSTGGRRQPTDDNRSSRNEKLPSRRRGVSAE